MIAKEGIILPRHITERMFMCYVAHSLRKDKDCEKFYGEANKLITVPVPKSEKERGDEIAKVKAAEARIDELTKLFTNFKITNGTPYKAKAREAENINIVTRNEDETFVISEDTLSDCADITPFHVMTLLGYNNNWNYLLQEASGQDETLKKLDADLEKIKDSVKTHKKFKLADNSLKYRLQLLGRHMSIPGSDCNGIFEGILWNLIVSNMNSSASKAHYKDIRYVGTIKNTHPGNEIDTGFLNHLKVMYNLAEALKSQTETEELTNAQKDIEILSQQIKKDREVSKEILETAVQSVYSLLLCKGNAIKITIKGKIEKAKPEREDCYASVKIVIIDKNSQKEKFSFDTSHSFIHAKVDFDPMIINKFDKKTNEFVETDPIAQVIDYNNTERRNKEGKNLEKIFNYMYLNDKKLEDWAQKKIKSNPILKQYYTNIQHLKFLNSIQGLENDADFVNSLGALTNDISPGTNIDVYNKDGKKLADLDLFIVDNYISKSTMAMDNYFQQRARILYKKGSYYYKFLEQHERIVHWEGIDYGIRFLNGSLDQVEICPFLGSESEGSEKITEFTIPEQIEINKKKLKVIGIFGENFFAKALPNLEKVTISNDNFNIGANVFSNCQNLKTLECKSKTVNVGDNAFYNCKSLETFKIPINIEKLEIGDKAFSSDSDYDLANKIKKFDLSGCVNLIEFNLGEQAFYNCKSLKNFKIPISIEKLTIGEGAFYYSGIKALDLSYLNLTELNIGANAFYYCKSLEDFKIPTSIEMLTIGEGAFFSSGIKSLDLLCLNLTEINIGEQVFCDCSSLRTFKIPINIEKLTAGKQAFSGSAIKTFDFSSCVNLTELNIGEQAFYKCKSLETFKIPTSIEKLTIGEKAFFGSAIKVLDLSDYAKLTEFNIENGVFYNCSELVNIHFPANLEKLEIGNEAFSSDSDYDFANKIKKFDLSGCVKLTELNIGEQAFCDCSSLRTFKIPINIEKLTIGEKAFSSSAIKAPDFSGCVKLTDLDIKKKAFFNCSKLETISFPESLITVKIGKQAFSNSKKDFANKIKELNFVVCKNLTELEIGEKAFFGCTSLKKPDLPQKIKLNIARDAFGKRPSSKLTKQARSVLRSKT